MRQLLRDQPRESDQKSASANITRMRRLRRHNKISLALFANAIGLALVALALFARNEDRFPSVIPAAYGQNQAAIGGGAGVFVVPAQFAPNFYGCYIMDVDAQTICAYQMIPGEHNFKLIAARSFRYDRRLNRFNTSEPSPNEVKALVEKEQAEVRAADAKRPPGSPEAPEKDK